VQSPVGKAGLALVETADGYRLEDGAGTRRRLLVPEGTRLSAVRELGDGWIVAGENRLGQVSDLVLIRQRGSQVETVPGPAVDPIGGSAAFRLDPQPLVAAGELVGLAWLEGNDREANAVRAARWTGAFWETTETVAPAVHEAQLALGSAVLADGSWLLVWAAYQESDDDIFWSRYHGGRWSEPQRLHADNDVPDIVPAVVAVAGGALASWSWFDGGDYRLKIARFDGTEWLDTGFRGEEGSLFPSFVERSGAATVLYTSVLPRAWIVLEIAADGSIERRAVAERGSETRPMIHGPARDGLTMRWIGGGVEGLRVTRTATERRIEWVGER
jgi:hypothetical protein